MQNKLNIIKPISTALLLAGCVLTQQTAMAVLPANPVLNFNDGENNCFLGGTYPACNHNATTVNPGSYFAMDTTILGSFEQQERIAMTNAATGLALFKAQAIGEIDFDWSFGGNDGRHTILNTLAVTSTGVNTYSINMAGWTVNWGTEGNIDMGAGAAATLTCAVDCAEGDTFTLDYQATVPTGAFSGVSYLLYLEGTIAIENIVVGVITPNITALSGALTCGTTAIASGSDSNLCNVTMNAINVPDNGFGIEQAVAQSCVGSCFDFEVNGLTPGNDAVVVLPLTSAIPEKTASNAGHKIVYRKLMSSGWQDFNISDNNRIASQAGTVDGAGIVSCPSGDDTTFTNGLTSGDRCLRLTITDGGPNDADGLANGTVVDPGGVSETFFTNGSDGCSMSSTPVNARERADWLLVALFISVLAGMGFYRRNSDSNKQ